MNDTQKELAGEFVASAIETSKKVTNRLKKSGVYIDEDDILSELLLSVVKTVGKFDPLKKLDGLVKRQFKLTVRNLMRSNKRIQDKLESIEGYGEGGENLRAKTSELDFNIDIVEETDCPHADDLRKWLAVNQDTKAAFPNASERRLWLRKKLPEIRKHLEKIYGYQLDRI